jgi:hypothetical protein
MKKDMFEIRRMLGENYHIFETFEYENGYKETWKVYAKYSGWIDDGSKPIMTSETHTYEDLYKFAKEHNVWDCDLIVDKVSIVINIITVIIAALNCFLNNKELRGFIWGTIMFSLIMSFTRIIISNHNWKISELKFKERMKRYEK